MSSLSGYFDFNATTPMSAVARDSWNDASARFWHNPSSLYREAGLAKRELDLCREAVADHLGIEEPDRVIFTSGATEANNAVLSHLAARSKGALLISAVEHPCVEAPARAFFGKERCRELAVDAKSGLVAVAEVADALKRGPVVAVSVMAANNETGTLQPWCEISALCRKEGVPFHCDAAQWIGKAPAADLGLCDFLTGSGHKFGGGKGVGFLVVPEGGDDFHGFIGGPQEDGRRAGTENLPAVLAMVAALRERDDESLETICGVAEAVRDRFEDQLAVMGVEIVGKAGPRLWNTSMIVLPHTRNLRWLTRLSQRGFSVSTGSACSAGKGNPSRVMAAMGLDFDGMSRVLRVSGGWETPERDWSALAAALLEVEAELRQ